MARWDYRELREIINDLIIARCIAPVPSGQRAPIDLKEPVRRDDAFFDTTVVKAPIHLLTDWMLLRDAVHPPRRTQGAHAAAARRVHARDEHAVHGDGCAAPAARQQEAAQTHFARHEEARQKSRRAHAQAHREALQTRRAETGLSCGQARVIEARMQSVIRQLSAAMKQAHERIIGARQVSNEEKILSLHDAKVEVIMHGKAKAEVESGNKLTLVESVQGLILDHPLHEDNPADSNLVIPRVERMKATPPPVKNSGLIAACSAAKTKGTSKPGASRAGCVRALPPGLRGGSKTQPSKPA